MTRRPRLGVVKPDYGVSGGFERHLEALLGELRPQFDTTIVSVDARTRPSRLGGLPVTAEMLAHHDEFFMMMALIDRVRALDLHHFDLVLTTQPPSYLADHPVKVALFYHHSRQFYDLEDLFVESGFVDEELHHAAAAAVRTAEADAPDQVHCWLAGSSEVARRLRRFWNVDPDRIRLHQAPPTTVPDHPPSSLDVAGPVVTVGRLEWPKRVELVVAAAQLHRRPTEIVGAGSRLGYLRSLDADLAAGVLDPSEADLWKTRGIFTPGWQPSAHPASDLVDFVTDAADAERDRRYEAASVVVCPAFDEDYGLTALEAMAWGRPVIVCRDGGGLTEFVEHGVNGLVVEPTAAGVAAGVEEIRSDPERAQQMSAAARRTAGSVTWEAASATVTAALWDALAAHA